LPAPQDILRNSEFVVEGYICKGTLYGEPMRKLKLSSRTVFTAHDMPYVVKVEFGYGYRQSWNEWVFWHNSAKHSADADWFAATHAVKVGMMPAHCWHGPKDLPCECHTTPWYVVANVQERILDAGKAIFPQHRKRSCANAQSYVAAQFPDLFDLKDYQFVHSAKRGHGVLVDYGMHGFSDDEGCDDTLQPALWDACTEDMNMYEWRMFEEPK